MSAGISDVVRRRRNLIARAAEQRIEFAVAARQWREPIAVASGAFRFGRALRRHPVPLVAVIATLLWLRRRRVLLWAGPLVAVWKLFRPCAGQSGVRGARRTAP
ncbi:MAG: YqjK family protein [Acidiferrobacterales bacterium]